MNKSVSRKLKKTFYKILVLGGIFFLGVNFLLGNAQAEQLDFKSIQKNIELNDGGAIFEISSSAQTVKDFLSQQNITLAPHDVVLPEKTEKIFSGTNVIILRAKKIIVKEGGNTNTYYTLQNTVEQAIWENKNIILSDDDITLPSRASLINDGETIAVTHVLIKEETKNLDIDFKSSSNNDDTLGWRIKKVTQVGVKGVRENKYKVVYNDGKEISRKILESNVTTNPINEIVTQGTFVKTGKASTGAASWYAFTGTLSAANPWLPLGSYVKVTNQDNGKTVIVKINDRGPFGKGRIIDLDKVAFAQIASIGQGMANVKMEVVLN